MMSTTQTQGNDLSELSRRVSTFVELTKPRLVAMILITTFAGFYLASSDSLNWLQLVEVIIGTGLSAAGVLALNQYLERDLDAQMVRTCNRPLPDKRVEPTTALFFGVLLTVGGLAFTAFCVNSLSALAISAIVVTYLFVYTPLKQKSPLCTIAGAVPGALPPVIGWVAARGTINIEAWTLFAILFLWQLPHSLSIACIYRDEYAQAGFRLLPVVHPDGKRHETTNCEQLFGSSCRSTAAHIGRHRGYPLLLRRASLERLLSCVRYQAVSFSYNRICKTVAIRLIDISAACISCNGA